MEDDKKCSLCESQADKVGMGIDDLEIVQKTCGRTRAKMSVFLQSNSSSIVMQAQ